MKYASKYTQYTLNTILVILIILCTIWSIIFYVRWEMRRRIRRLFIQVVNELEKEGVDYWVDFGTLLGITRDRDIIMGDYDGDICIVPGDENLQKCAKVARRMDGSYSEKDVFRIKDKTWFFVHIDLFVPTVIENDVYKTPCGEKIPIGMIHPIRKTECLLGDHQIHAPLPHRVEEVLTNRYGKGWGVPSRKWWLAYTDVKLELDAIKSKI